MRLRVINIFVFLMASLLAQGQALKPVNFYLQHSGVSENAIDFYTGRLSVMDADKAMEIADSMFTENDETRPFYILLTTRMLKVSRGKLSKQLTIISRHFAEQHPSELSAFLYQKNSLISRDFPDYWAYRLSVDIRVMCEYELLTCFKESRNVALKNCSEKYKPQIEILYNIVRHQLNLFQQR